MTALLPLLPLTPHNWLSAVGAIPRLVQLMSHASTTAPQVFATQSLLRCISSSNVYLMDGVEPAPDGIIPPLVSLLLRLDDVAVCCMAATNLASLAVNVSNQRKMIAAGVIEPFVQLLDSGSEDIQHAASRALVHLSLDNTDGQAKIIAAGAIASLIRLLQTASWQELQAHAAMALSNLASNNAKLVVGAGAVPILVERLTAASIRSQEQAAFALQTIAKDFDTHAAILAAAPLLPLVRLLASSSEGAQEYVMTALLLISSAPTFPQQFVAAGAVPPLVQMLRHDSTLVQRNAIRILCLLATRGTSDVYAAVERAGALPLLARLQATSSSEELRHEAKTLQRLPPARLRLQPLPCRLRPLPPSIGSSSSLPGRRGRAAGGAVRRACH